MVHLSRRFLVIIGVLVIIFSQKIKAQNLFSTELITSTNDTLMQTDFKGKIVLLNFWFIGCAPCLREIPELNKIADDYSGKVVFIAVSKNNTKEQINYFIKKFPFLFTQVLPNKDLITGLDISLYPTNILFNAKGEILFRSEGYYENTINSLRKEIEKLIE